MKERIVVIVVLRLRGVDGVVVVEVGRDRFALLDFLPVAMDHSLIDAIYVDRIISKAQDY